VDDSKTGSFLDILTFLKKSVFDLFRIFDFFIFFEAVSFLGDVLRKCLFGDCSLRVSHRAIFEEAPLFLDRCSSECVSMIFSKCLTFQSFCPTCNFFGVHGFGILESYSQYRMPAIGNKTHGAIGKVTPREKKMVIRYRKWALPFLMLSVSCSKL
jgi:hypothetical protein